MDPSIREAQLKEAEWQKQNKRLDSQPQVQAGEQLAWTGGERNTQPGEPHPRETLLAELNDQEQRLLDKLHTLRDIRLEICALPRDEAKRLLTISRLTERMTP